MCILQIRSVQYVWLDFPSVVFNMKLLFLLLRLLELVCYNVQLSKEKIKEHNNTAKNRSDGVRNTSR